MNVQVCLIRRNLETLLTKLDNPLSARSIIKSDTEHPVYPLRGADSITVTAVEDFEYYTDREPGIMMENLQ
jgi:hypothetical protein